MTPPRTDVRPGGSLKSEGRETASTTESTLSRMSSSTDAVTRNVLDEARVKCERAWLRTFTTRNNEPPIDVSSLSMYNDDYIGKCHCSYWRFT